MVAESIGAMFAESSKRFAQKPVLKGRVGKKFMETSYNDLSTLVERFGAGLISLGISPSDNIFVLSDNRKEWLVSDLAILSVGAINISRGGDSTPVEVEYIVSHSIPQLIIVENREQLHKIKSLKGRLPQANKIVIIDDNGAQGEDSFYSYQQVLGLGKESLAREQDVFTGRLKQVRSEDLAAIVYTSGTTGTPKGVMLTHRNILSNVEAARQAIHIEQDDRLLSILPSWHMFERTVEYVGVRQGASLVYTTPRTIKEDMVSEKPNYVVGVPRIWEVFYTRISKTLKEQNAFISGAVAVLLRVGKRYTLASRIIRNEDLVFSRENPMRGAFKRLRAFMVKTAFTPAYWLGNLIAFRKIRRATGGSLKAAVSGGGSFPPYLDDFFETVGVPVINGYGLTETSPVLTARTVSHNVRGTVGRPLMNTEVKVVNEEGAEVPIGDQGVVLAKGPQVMKGYYKDEEATRKVMREGGWFDTGDLGRMALSGDLALTGRAKDTIVLISGENVEPEPMETLLKESEYIENVIVVGQDRRSLAALIRPDLQVLSETLLERGIHSGDVLCEPYVEYLLREEITRRINEAKDFKPFEKIAKFKLVEEEWNRENGLLTPTLKLKRNVIVARYRDLIETIYEQKG